MAAAQGLHRQPRPRLGVVAAQPLGHRLLALGQAALHRLQRPLRPGLRRAGQLGTGRLQPRAVRVVPLPRREREGLQALCEAMQR